MVERKYDNLVFDLGGVILDIDREQCVKKMLALGFKDIDTYLGLYKQTGMFLDVETGAITAAQFYDAVREHIGNPDLKDVQIEEAFTAFIIGLPKRRIEMLAQYRRQGYKVYVLSNTNPVMFHSIIDKLFRHVSGDNIYSCFDGVLTSFENGVCKPDPKIFDILLRRFGLDATRTLFYDDGQANCDAARACGINSVLVPPGTEFYDIVNL